MRFWGRCQIYKPTPQERIRLSIRAGAATKLKSHHSDPYCYEILGKVSDIQTQATRENQAVNKSRWPFPTTLIDKKALLQNQHFFVSGYFFRLLRSWHSRRRFPDDDVPERSSLLACCSSTEIDENMVTRMWTNSCVSFLWAVSRTSTKHWKTGFKSWRQLQDNQWYVMWERNSNACLQSGLKVC